MTEVLFYHLTGTSPKAAIPALLEKSLERGWRVVVQTEDKVQCDELDVHLWTYRDDSFLPHGSENNDQDTANSHPVWLTTTPENPNEASVRFVLNQSVPAGIEEYERVIYMFDGRDEETVGSARERWKIEKDAGHDLTYWQQDEQGRWQKKA